MKTFGSKQRLCIGAWGLAALALIGLNGFGYLALESKPLEGSSMAIRSLRQKLVRLDSVLPDAILNTLGQQSAKGSPAVLLTAQSAQDQSSPAEPIQPPLPKAVLPVLTGILHVANQLGAPDYMAVIDGRVCQAKDRVKEFVVDTICAKGVVLRRNEEHWLIESPAPYYSSDQGQ